MAEELWHFVGGERVKGSSGHFGDIYWPMTGEVAARVPLASPDEVRAAVTTTAAPPMMNAISVGPDSLKILLRSA